MEYPKKTLGGFVLTDSGGKEGNGIKKVKGSLRIGPSPQATLIEVSKNGELKRFCMFSVLNIESFINLTGVLSPATLF